ncbi:MAG: hypothetical protein LBU51_08695, partial [Bacteroidales bacterium]|nr:hypothetical protein [Bacteroidales bacterium]
ETIMSKLFSDTTFNNEQCLNCNKLPLCYGTCIQKHYETKIGESSFHCSHDFSEISLKEYIQEKVHIQQ